MSADGNPSPVDRRPIPARNLGVSKLLTHWLVSWGVAPNAISVFGMLFASGAGVLLAATGLFDAPRFLLVIAAVLVALRLLCNMLDGMVAVESRSASPIGDVFNEVPDRIADLAVLVGAGYCIGGEPTLGWAAACVAILTAYVRSAMKVAGAPNDYSGPMAKQQRMAIIIAIAVYVGLAPMAWLPQWGPGSAWGLMAMGLILITVGGVFTMGRRITRGLRRLRGHVPVGR